MTTLTAPKKCNNCGFVADAPDKVQHFVQMRVRVIENIEGPWLLLDFCTDSCRDQFITENECD